jgi:hypothetical protein
MIQRTSLESVDDFIQEVNEFTRMLPLSKFQLRAEMIRHIA